MDKVELAAQVVDLARAQVLARNHFLSAAVGRLGLEPAVLGEQFVTDGYKLYFDATRVLEAFKESGKPPEHDLLHSVAHCLFLHPYVGPSVNQLLWDAACDIVAERIVAELIGPRPGARGAQLATAVGRIERDVSTRASAEKIYARLCAGAWESEIDAWKSLAHSDDHTAWYVFRGSEDSSDGESGDGSGESGRFKAADAGEGSSDASDGASASGKRGDDADDADGGASSGSDGSQGGDDSPNPDEGDALSAAEGAGSFSLQAGDAVSQMQLTREGLRMRQLSRPSVNEQMEAWRQVATSLSVNLQTMSARQGSSVSGFIEDLGQVAQKRQDYADFLRQFATFGEVMRISDDEFDSIFYTYGMKVYGNMPLIEPLEYREEKRVREFVIVIDTSGSVSGDAVRRFVETTFGILRSTESFFEKVHLRIIQCDARVQSDDRIDSMAELAQWGSQMKLLGCGGTDFRPAFSYVDALVDNGEFANLGGLVYFTDGQGSYPEWMPSYRTAFVFYGEDAGASSQVPPWAVQMTLDDDHLDKGNDEDARGGLR